MSLSDEIIGACAENDTPLATILRKCLILSAKLRSNDLKDWALKELEGYGPDDEVPSYRILGITAKGVFLGNFGGQLNNQPLPSGILDEKHRHWATTAKTRQGIASLEALVGKDATGTASVNWPADMVVHYQSKFFEDYSLNRAWQEIPISSLLDITDTVRTRVLRFMLELQEEVGDIDDIVARHKVAEVAPVVQYVFQTTVYGGTAIVGSETGDVDARTQTVVQGDIDALIKALHDRGIGDPEIRELQAAIEADVDRQRIAEKPNVEGWIKKTARKIGGTASGIAVDVAKASLTSLVSSYLGLPPPIS